MFPTEIKDFSSLITGSHLIFLVCLSILNAILLFYASLKFLLSMQQTGYKGKKYLKWVVNAETPYLKRLMLLCLMGFLFFCVLNTTFIPMVEKEIASYIGFVSYLLFTVTYIKTESSINAKVPLRKTRRLVRLAVVYVILLAVFSFALLLLMETIAYWVSTEIIGVLRYSLICLTPILTPFILFLAYGLILPLEEFIKSRYVKIAKNKLAKKNVVKIAITGSYGKTSVKEILKTLFSQKYRVLATPMSYNTPMGLGITIRGLDSTHDIFIAEMGARYKGDIKALADMVKPDFAVLTGINTQHLETFGSIDVTKQTKFELFESLKEDGIAFFSADNEGAIELYQKFNGEKYLSGFEGDDNLVKASNVTVTQNGTNFTLTFEKNKSINCTTTLLGRHNVKNICLASAVAYKVGLSLEEIEQGINRLSTIEHRLELMPNNKNIVIIDDSYNSNVDGVKAAMEVLDTFEGRKIIITPGLVELGKEENVANFEMGKLIANHVDVAIIVGSHNAEMLINGLKEAGFNAENIMFATTLKKGNDILNEIMKEKDVVLFENDLPDNYN